MLLEKLSCQHFKNYQSLVIHLTPQINCIVGPNGAGKTNLLDAIHYLCLTKSAFQWTDNQHIQHQEAQFGLLGDFIKFNKLYEIKCKVERETGKTFYKNGKVYDKLRDHIGELPLVLTTPYDAILISGSSEIRRRFFDVLLCQLDKVYLKKLVDYQIFIKQRNSLLRMCMGDRPIDKVLLATYDEQILRLAQQLYEKRKNLMEFFIPHFQQHYRYFVTAPENVAINYKSDVEKTDFVQQYIDNLSQDRLMGRTTLGIHRDDFIFSLNEYPLKKLGSQGQQKSFVLSLRLAQFTTLYHHLNCKPILLLDDIFDKLDEHRMGRFMDLVGQKYFGQVLLTDAEGIRSKNILKNIQVDKAFFQIEGGKLVKHTD